MTWDLVADGYLSEVVPMFTQFAEAALALAQPPPSGHILDVACGPGTLTLVAAKSAARVDALDFSPAMIERLQARAPKNVFPRVGDGQALPYPDQSFDAAFSMFGLIFFPDRAKGLSELKRVLKPGGRVVISSWPPADRLPLMNTIFLALRELNPGTPDFPTPLGDPADYERELGAAGFTDVRVKTHTVLMSTPSLDALWESLAKSLAPLVVMRKFLGEERFAAVEQSIRRKLADRFGTGEQRIEMTAWLGLGTA